MTDELVNQFNWQKSEKKREFGNTRVSNVLFREHLMIIYRIITTQYYRWCFELCIANACEEWLGFSEAAKDCPLFMGPNTKAEYKAEMVDFVFRATKQRYRNSLKKTRDAESVREEIRRLKQMRDDNDVDSADDIDPAEEDEEFADDELD